MEDMAPNYREKNGDKWFQFSLRFVLLIMALAAVGFAFPNGFRNFVWILGCGFLGIALYRIARKMLARVGG